jgi:hypothetical protein
MTELALQSEWRRAHPKQVSLLLPRKKGCGARKRNHSVPTSCKPNSDTHWSVQVGEKCTFFFGPETVRPSGQSGLGHSTMPCGLSSCGERSTWLKCAKWTDCRSFAWRSEVESLGGRFVWLDRSAECQIVTRWHNGTLPVKSLSNKHLTVCHEVAELAHSWRHALRNIAKRSCAVLPFRALSLCLQLHRREPLPVALRAQTAFSRFGKQPLWPRGRGGGQVPQ